MSQNCTCAVLILQMDESLFTTAPRHPQGQYCSVRRGGRFSYFFFAEDENGQMRLFPKKIPGHDLPVQIRLDGPPNAGAQCVVHSSVTTLRQCFHHAAPAAGAHVVALVCRGGCAQHRHTAQTTHTRECGTCNAPWSCICTMPVSCRCARGTLAGVLLVA